MDKNETGIRALLNSLTYQVLSPVFAVNSKKVAIFSAKAGT